MDSESLAHTKWNCKYHIVFAPKYRRQIIYGRLRTEIGKILRELCKRKEIEILEAEACPDHIHMLLSIPPKYSVSSVMGYLKGKSSLMIFDRFANLKYKYGNREFWCRGYYVDTVGRNKAAIEKYIRNQLIEDKNEEQLVMKETRLRVSRQRRTGNSYEGSGEQYKAPDGKIDRSCFSISLGKSATGSLFQGAYQRLPVLWDRRKKAAVFCCLSAAS